MLLHICIQHLEVEFTSKDFNSICEQIFTTVINEEWTSPRDTNMPRYKWTIETPANYFRILHDNSPKLQWNTIAKTNMLNCYWPQRKLLFAYLELLTELRKIVNLQNVSVIYSGASPGHHIPLLIRFFKCDQWILIGKSNWDSYLTKNSKLKVTLKNDKIKGIGVFSTQKIKKGIRPKKIQYFPFSFRGTVLDENLQFLSVKRSNSRFHFDRTRNTVMTHLKEIFR